MMVFKYAPIVNAPKVVMENIPLELQGLKHWCLWGEKKIPFQPNGQLAESDNEETWSTLDEVLAAFHQNEKFLGIGFMFKPPFCGFDFDDVYDPVNDEIDPDALLILSALNSYTEISPSGTGFHTIVKLEKPLPKERKIRNGKFECYEEKRFFTFSTNVYANKREIEWRTIEAEKVVKQFFAKKEQPQLEVIHTVNPSEKLTKDQVYEVMMRSRNADKLQKFLDGNWEALGKYPSQSEADAAFLLELAFYTQKDAAMMEEIFCESGMYREKWHRRQSGTYFGNLEIQGAIAICRNVYNPSGQLEKKIVGISFNESQEQFLLPYGYISKNGALYKVIDKSGRGNAEPQPIEVLICRQTPIITRSFSNVEYPQLYHEISWVDNGKPCIEVVLAGDLAIKKELLKLSYKSLAVTDNNAKELIDYFDKLNMVNQNNREYLVERIGHIKSSFVHPLRERDIKILPSDAGEKQMLAAFQSSGSVEDWLKNVLEPIKKHPQALLMVLASFTSVLLKDLKIQPFIVDLSGPTSRGKTSVLLACASVWGNGDLVSEWSLTKVSAERKAAFLNSFPLILDDTRKADSRQLQSFVYTFSGGRSRGRGSVSGSQGESEWNNILLSTGEAALTEYGEAAAGVAARILSITGIPFENVDFGFFGDLYNGIEENYGTVGLSFVEQWHTRKSALIPEFKQYNEIFQKKSQGNEVISRIARNYSAIVFTGKLLNVFFECDIDLMLLYKTFDELMEENKAIDKPKQLLELILQDLDADRGAIFRNNSYGNRTLKAYFKDGTLYFAPYYLKEFLKTEEKSIRNEWLRRGMTIIRENRGKRVDYQQIKVAGQKFSGIAVEPRILKELGFDFSEEPRNE